MNVPDRRAAVGWVPIHAPRFRIHAPRFAEFRIDSPCFAEFRIDSPCFAEFRIDSPCFAGFRIDSPRFAELRIGAAVSCHVLHPSGRKVATLWRTLPRMTRRWRLAALSAVCGVIIAAVKIAQGASPGGAAVLLAVFLVLAVVTSPLVFPRPAGVANGRPVIYWRPGCPFCLRLRARLGPDAARFAWVDIWADPAAAAIVRGFADGNETVPTVVINGEGFVNPDPQWVREKVQL
ncbi:Glutaredoxin-C4 [Actinoplanes sp. SE50]|uniref:glutaredoxin domain-containing protein n=1 Tax=unclassified Actinoplanes TaxID=2626549 RepID=UPI00023EBFD1|nr:MULTISPECIES: glutaredoxin domain-containing protein [unclassified Actinoplanes]AEV87493.1 Glutaredoxin-C4 [Actinoplanes sp. SE50/110]ATO85896.1 Glutaredoxin-C4 [Actinoplanes sp. SE50]SLM03310.1 Putative glutaredoxin,1/MT3292 [Actinoplanes sp. SE50/110]